MPHFLMIVNISYGSALLNGFIICKKWNDYQEFWIYTGVSSYLGLKHSDKMTEKQIINKKAWWILRLKKF